MTTKTISVEAAAAIRKAEYQQLCGHPNGYPSPFGAETPMRELGRPAAGTPYQEEPAGV